MYPRTVNQQYTFTANSGFVVFNETNAAILPDLSEDSTWLVLIGTVGSQGGAHICFGASLVTAVGVTLSGFVMLFVYFV